MWGGVPVPLKNDAGGGMPETTPLSGRVVARLIRTPESLSGSSPPRRDSGFHAIEGGESSRSPDPRIDGGPGAFLGGAARSPRRRARRPRPRHGPALLAARGGGYVPGLDGTGRRRHDRRHGGRTGGGRPPRDDAGSGCSPGPPRLSLEREPEQGVAGRGSLPGGRAELRRRVRSIPRGDDRS